MRNKEHLEAIRKSALSDCMPGMVFWGGDGTVIRNIYELVTSIENMNDYDFIYHVNEDNHKNDFAMWIRKVLCDDELACKLDRIMDKEMYLKIIKKRIKKLEES